MINPNLKILIAEDFNTLRLQLTKMLNMLGFDNITEATDGEDAWNQMLEEDMKGEPFELVLSDINMPIMTGIELLEKVRSHFREMPFIIISSENEKKLIVRALELKVNNYLLKPMSVDVLKEKILKTFNEK